MKKKTFSMIALALASSLVAGNLTAQDSKLKAVSDTIKTKVGETSNVMLNASSDNGPRDVNIGLPKSVGGTVVLENGLPVTYDFSGLMPTSIWRQDNGIAKFNVLNVSQTAILASDVGVSVSTWTNRGTEKTKGAASFATNTFGLLRGDVSISGPIKNNWYYSATAFLNFDPSTYRSNISQFLNQTQIFKGVINKKYANGQVGIQYKFANSASLSGSSSPYIYHKDGSVTALPNFRIGRDAYLEQSGKIYGKNPLTGENVTWDAMDDSKTTAHVVDILGDHKFGNGVVLDYTVRYMYANSGSYIPYQTSIVQANSESTSPKENDTRYYYTDGNVPYTGLVQKGMMIFTPRFKKNTVMGRFEFSKKTEKHNWMLGFHNWFYRVDKPTTSTYSYLTEVAPNPKSLGYDQYVGGKWVPKTDANGSYNHNVAMQYYNGYDNKMALVGSEKWKINDKFSVDAGARIEWQRIDGDWMPTTVVGKDDKEKDITERVKTDIKKNWFNLSATASLTYKAFDNFGFLADLYYLEQAGKLSSYAGADDPAIETCQIPGLSGGVYFNHPIVRLVSKFTKIKRTNFKNNSTFNATWTDTDYPGQEFVASKKQTISYDVNTIGWTTDVLFTPFKGFNLHLLLTLQNPKYENYDVTVNYSAKTPDGKNVSEYTESISNSGKVARSVSKTLIEIDPSYSFSKFRIWASARYFSKEYANYPNTLIFKERWETFAGLNYKYDKNVDFSISAVNLLNQSGAQGSISGSNTLTAEDATKLYDTPLVGTYIRPFTIEFKTKIRF